MLIVGSSARESHIQTFMHLLLTSGLPLLPVSLPHLDYASHLTREFRVPAFCSNIWLIVKLDIVELYERVTGSGNKVFTIRYVKLHLLTKAPLTWRDTLDLLHLRAPTRMRSLIPLWTVSLSGIPDKNSAD
jgi:hypothetical protein